MPRDVGVVVVAAGRGERAGPGGPKQFRSLAGLPIVAHAIQPFSTHPAVCHIVVVVPESFVAEPPSWLRPRVGQQLSVVAGGYERMDSVERGFAALPAAASVVLVHDGARPFPDRAVIDTIVSEARAGRGAIAAIPVSDTLKEAAPSAAGAASMVRRTVPRDGLWRAQTPQGFPREVLASGLARARQTGSVAPDEAALVEALEVPVVLVRDVARNLKVTTPDDFVLAEALARGPA